MATHRRHSYPRSVPEMAHTGKYHGDAPFVGRGDHLLVANAAARLNDCDRAVVADDIEAVAKGKERIRRDDRPRERDAGIGGLDRSNARGVDAAHLSRADTERAPPSRVDDRVGLDELGDAPREHQVIEL